MKVEAYDFRRPNRLAADIEKRLKRWLTGACAMIVERWTQSMASVPALSIDSLRAGYGSAALEQLPDPAVGYRIEFGPRRIKTLLAIPRQLALALAAELLGESLELMPDDREPTPVEWSLCEFMVQEMLAALSEAWPGNEPVPLSLIELVERPRRSRAFLPDESLALLQLEVAGSFGKGLFHWLVPLEPLKQELTHWGGAPASEEPEQARPKLETLARQIPVELTISLGSSVVPVAELAKLKVGDVVVLDQPISEPLLARVGDGQKYRVWLGRVGTRHAVKVAGLVQPAEP